MKFCPSLLYQESKVAKFESFDDACNQLFFESTSPHNIFHLLLINKKNNSFEKKFEIFIDLLSQGADLNKELKENKNLKSKLINFFELESDDEETKYFENKLLFKLKEFKIQLRLIPALGGIPNSRNLYIKSISYLQKIASFYEKQFIDSTPDLSCVKKFYYKITEMDFFSKKQPEEIEYILNFMGFLTYLNESKFIDFVYKKFEKYMKRSGSEMLQEEKNIYNSINILIETLPDYFELRKNQKIHYAQIEEIKNENSLQYLVLRKKFLMSVKAIIEDQISKREEDTKKKDTHSKKLKEKGKDLKKERTEVKKIQKKEEQRILKEREREAKKEALEKIIKENEELVKKTAEEKASLEAKKKADKARRTEEFHAKKQAEDKARIEAEERLKIEQENARIEAEERLKIEQENARIEAEERLKIEQENARIEAEEISKLVTNISKRIQNDFEIFDPLFDFLNHSEMWVKPSEIGFYGSRVYGPFVENIFPQSQLKSQDSSSTDYDFFCIADGVFACCYNELIAKENFEKLFEKFNQKNPNFQIDFKATLGKTNVNLNKFKKSLNFKLVATIDGKDHDFDLNFYSTESKSQNLQWQINPERITLCKIEDQYQFVINQNYGYQRSEITIFEFFQKMKVDKDYILGLNEEAFGFLNRIIKKRGIYKFYDQENIDKIKQKLMEEFPEKLVEELDRYKKFLCSPARINDEIYKSKKIEFEAIFKEVALDKILSKLVQEKTPQSYFLATEAKAIFFKFMENVAQ